MAAWPGRKGGGKPTPLRGLAGLTRPWRGSAVRLAGKPIAGKAPEAVAALGVSYGPDDRRVFPDLTAAENLRVPVLALRRARTRWTRGRFGATLPPLAPCRDR